MIGEFRAGEVHEPVDDADTERFIFYQVQDRELKRIGERMIGFAFLFEFFLRGDASNPGTKDYRPNSGCGCRNMWIPAFF